MMLPLYAVVSVPSSLKVYTSSYWAACRPLAPLENHSELYGAGPTLTAPAIVLIRHDPMRSSGKKPVPPHTPNVSRYSQGSVGLAS